LTKKVADLKLNKGSAADIKAANDKIIALRKAEGQAKKAAEKAAKGDDEEEGEAPKATAEATKAAEPKPAEPKGDAAKGAKGKKPEAKAEPAKAEPAKDEPKKEEPKKEEPKKDAAKGKKTERKQSTKEETPAAPVAAKPGHKDEAVVVHAAPPAATSGKLQILAISGSLRKGSYNTALLHTAQKFAHNAEIKLYDIGHLPMYNQDNEYEDNQEVKRFKAAITAADAILIATPEYNYSMPGVLKNALDVASRPWGQSVWSNKHVGLVSAAMGFTGGVRAQLAFRQSAVFLKMIIYPGPAEFSELAIPEAHTKFDDKGTLTDERSLKNTQAYVEGFVGWVAHERR